MRHCLGLWLGLAVAAGVAAPAQAQPPRKHTQARVDPLLLPVDFPRKPSTAPSWTIPVEPLGFAGPGALYLGSRDSLASLDFIGEDRLLFTFHVSALLHRPLDGEDGDEREIRAVVLDIPSGKVEAEANWLLYDKARYLWMLRNGHFLLRDRDTLLEGDASLNLKPVMRFPGPLLSISLDPSQQLLVATSREPAEPTAKSSSGAAAADADSNDMDGISIPSQPDLVERVLRRNSGQVLLMRRLRDPIHLPVDAEGYVRSVHENGVDWRIEMNLFAGGKRSLGGVKSACAPDLRFFSNSELLAEACADWGKDAVVVLDTAGRRLWVDLVPDRQAWPIFFRAANGQRIGRETLYSSHSVDAMNPLGDRDIEGQWLQVLDAATGRLVFEAPVSPILDGGGNAALSPSGRRVAVLNGSSIQIFELPAPPPLPNVQPSSR